jgi:hypothetical protein
LIPAIEITRWIYVAERSNNLKEAQDKFFAPYPSALQGGTASTWIFVICLTIAAIIFLANWNRGMFFRIIGIFSAILAFWNLFSLM